MQLSARIMLCCITVYDVVRQTARAGQFDIKNLIRPQKILVSLIFALAR